MPSAITGGHRTQDAHSHQKNWSLSQGTSSLGPHFFSLYNGNNKIHSGDGFHAFNKYLPNLNHMSVTMLGDTVVNITITSYLEEPIVSVDAGRLVKKVLQISKDYYPITKSCSSSVFLNLVNDITIHSAVQLGNCPQLLPPSFYPQFP